MQTFFLVLISITKTRKLWKLKGQSISVLIGVSFEDGYLFPGCCSQSVVCTLEKAGGRFNLDGMSADGKVWPRAKPKDSLLVVWLSELLLRTGKAPLGALISAFAFTLNIERNLFIFPVHMYTHNHRLSDRYEIVHRFLLIYSCFFFHLYQRWSYWNCFFFQNCFWVYWQIIFDICPFMKILRTDFSGGNFSNVIFISYPTEKKNLQFLICWG